MPYCLNMDDLDTEFDEVQLAEIIYSMLARAIKLLAANSLDEAALELDEIERLMESIKTQGGHIDSTLVLMVLQNKACIFQRMGQSMQCAAYLEACVYNLKSDQLSHKSAGTKQRLQRLVTRRTLARTLLQMAVVHSKAGRHQVALDKARRAWKEFNYLIKDSLHFSELYLKTQSKLALKSEPLDPNTESNSIVSRAKAVFEYLHSRLIVETDARPPELTSRSALGVLDYTSSIFTADIASISMIQPSLISSLSINLSFKREFSQESLTDTVRSMQAVLAIGVYYCLATELHYAAPEVKQYDAEGKSLHRRILEVAEDLLPTESPLVEYLKVTYTRHFGDLKPIQTQRNSKRMLELHTQRERSPLKPTQDLSIQTSFRSTSAKFKKRPSQSPSHRKPKIRSKFVSPERNLPTTAKLLKDIEKLLKSSSRSQGKSRQPEPTPPVKDSRETPVDFNFSSEDLYGL